MRVLVLNCGSSSVKMALIDPASRQRLFRGQVERIGQEGGMEGEARWGDGPETRELLPPGDYGTAIRWLAERLDPALPPDAVGHRVVHGGEAYVGPVIVDDAVAADLERLSRLAPLHNPPNLAGIRAARELFPRLPQVAVFDTAFHASLPERAFRYALPERFYRELGVRRYGFHGLSHRYVAERVAAILGRADLRLVSLHLGAGCSAAAIAGGRSLDTSMGMTPLEGLVMGTRCGDLDPAIPLLLQTQAGVSPEAVDRILNHESGLRALADGRQDMREVLAAMRAGDPAACLAFDLFCYRVRKYVGAYAAALGGLDVLAFTAGIGENSAEVRAAVCSELGFLGVRLDPARNRETREDEREIGAADAPVRVLVIPTDEEWVIARDTEARIAAAAEP